MFSSASNAIEHNAYDLNSEENVGKWRGLLVTSLQKVQRQVHPSLNAKEDALAYIEELIVKLLGMLCASQPHSVSNVEERVSNTFPHPIDKWAMTDAQNALDKGKKKSPLVLPVDKIHPLVKEVLGYKVETQVTMYIVAVLEYIAADILKLTGNYVKNIKHPDITCQDIKVAMCADKVLMDMFFQDDEVSLGVEEELPRQRRDSLTYEDIVKDLVLEETQYTRDLNMIIKVFRAPFAKLFPRSKDLEVIFSNIIDIAEFTANLLSSLEDALEMSDQSSSPCVGAVLEELAEAAEFDVYEKYADDMLRPNGRQRLNTLLQRNDASLTFQSAGHGFKDAVKYVLPKLLLGPIYHCLHFFEVIKVLIELSKNEEDRESLCQADGLLHQLKVDLEHKLGPGAKRKPHDVSLRLQGRGGRQAALTKMSELQKSIDGWEGKDIGKSCNKFIMEGTLLKYTGKRMTERYVFLFDGLIILTKQNTKRSSVTGPVGDYKLKEKFQMRKVDIIDKDDTEDMKNAFELQIKEHPSVTLAAKTVEEKNNWMAALVSLLTRSMLERMLDGYLVEEEKQQPLRIPSWKDYRFAKEDSEENIVFEDNQDPGVESPLIKGGTLLKLVERLTYHMYADPKFVRTFLTTYRSFCEPADLLDLLKERFSIPDPPPLMNTTNDVDVDPATTIIRDDLKRFRLEYKKPIQIRVLNVLRHWVDQHYYDFVWHYDLLDTLQTFLETVKGKAMKKCVESIRKAIKRRENSASAAERNIVYEKPLPRILWHITEKYEHFDLMTLHPIEIARQVTLLEFDLYRMVKPSELVGSVWVKESKKITSPNLLRMIEHSTTFTFWLEKLIIEAENFDERVAVMSRILEIMIVFYDLNNFNGVLEVVSAINSASVHRLRHTFEEVASRNSKLMKAWEDCNELNSDHYKNYIEKLRSINPPCVPFLGMYLTNILHIEEGNPDYLPNRPEGIINFSKRRKVAEITQEIQQYQNQPYCLNVQPEIKRYFENLDVMSDMTEKEFNDYLYSKSLDLEPRNCKAPSKFEKKRDYSLKSPGLKLLSSRHSTSTIGRSEKSHPTSLATTPSTPTFPHINEEVGDMDSSCDATPPTPSTPITPPHDTSDQSVFASVLLPGPEDTWSVFSGSSMMSRSTIATVSTLTGHSIQPSMDKPPPLPPRVKKRESSLSGTGELSPVRQHPDAPFLPPREGAPPLPPRRNELVHTIQTLPRNIGIIRPQLPGASTTLPRRNSDRDATPVNINGDRGGSVTPELPPKTYRCSHSRKQSS